MLHSMSCVNTCYIAASPQKRRHRALGSVGGVVLAASMVRRSLGVLVGGFAVRVDHPLQRPPVSLVHLGGRAGNRRQRCELGRRDGRPHQDDEAVRPLRHLVLRGPVAELGAAVRGRPRRVVA